MPRIALVCLVLVGACRFDADYSGRYTCGDTEHKCPSPLVCDTLQNPPVCIERRMDAAIDTVAPDDSMIDARKAALTCVDPGVLSLSDSESGSTVDRTSMSSTTCSGAPVNGADAIYQVTIPTAGNKILVSIATTTSGYGVVAYVIAPCPASACLGGTYATTTAPISVTTTFAGLHYIVVDSPFSAQRGDYTVTVDVQ